MSRPESSNMSPSVSANPRLCTAPPCIWPSTPSGLIAFPASCTTTKSWSVTSPVSGSTSTLASWAAKAGACTANAMWLTPRTGHLRHVEVALLPDLGERDRAARDAADRHLAVLDLEILDRRLHLRGRDLEGLATRVLRGLHDRRADRVDRLAPRAEPGQRRAVGVPG